jgi:hypothetical protein
MGILFNTSTWRAPLLMISSWLPPRTEVPARRPQPAVLQRFVRAGWLGRRAPARTERPTSVAERFGPPRAVPTNITVKRGGRLESWGADSRLVIAGRMSEVCAELDRLVAMEQQRRPGT